jgi:hypothetical protein
MKYESKIKDENTGFFLLQSYINNRAFIVTEFQPTEGAINFLRLLVDHESETVISMNPLKDIGAVCGVTILK